MGLDWTWDRAALDRDPAPGRLGPRSCGEPWVAVVEIDRERITRALGPAHFPNEILGGIGPMQVWRFIAPCGAKIAIWLVDVFDVPATKANVLSDDPDIDHVLHHLALSAPVACRVDDPRVPARPIPPEPWTLVRQDDNGHRIAMRTFESKVAAECARRTYEARGHKQLYSIERAPVSRP